MRDNLAGLKRLSRNIQVEINKCNTLEEYILKQEQKISRLQAREKEAREILKEMEWSSDPPAAIFWCCICGQIKPSDHKSTCRLARWLKGE